jgi:importin subunit alpha-1
VQAVFDILHSTNTFPRLMQFVGGNSRNLQSPALRILGNMFAAAISNVKPILDCGICAALKPLITDQFAGVHKEACWTISNIVATPNTQEIQMVLDANLLPPIVKLLKEADPEVKQEAAWVITNALDHGTTAQVHAIVKDDVIPPLCQLIKRGTCCAQLQKRCVFVFTIIIRAAHNYKNVSCFCFHGSLSTLLCR